MSDIIKHSIIEFVVRELLDGDPEPIEEEPDLLQSELIDSIGIIRLIAFMEQEFAVSIPPEDVTLDHFRNVDAMTEYLTSRGAAVHGVGEPD